jgi:hypothetical protein
MAAEPILRCVTETESWDYVITKERTVIGRSANTGAQPDCALGAAKAISRQHAVLTRVLTRVNDAASGLAEYHLQCLAKNPIAINEETFSSADPPARVQPRDRILIGPVALYFLEPDDGAAPPAALPTTLLVGGGSLKKRLEASRVQDKVDRLFSAVPDTPRSEARLGLYPIVTFQYSSTTLYQFSYHIQ